MKHLNSCCGQSSCHALAPLIQLHTVPNVFLVSSKLQSAFWMCSFNVGAIDVVDATSKMLGTGHELMHLMRQQIIEEIGSNRAWNEAIHTHNRGKWPRTSLLLAHWDPNVIPTFSLPIWEVFGWLSCKPMQAERKSLPQAFSVHCVAQSELKAMERSNNAIPQ